MKEHNIVELNIDLPLLNLCKGDKGVIVHVHPDGKTFEVEVSKGKCTHILTLKKKEVR